MIDRLFGDVPRALFWRTFWVFAVSAGLLVLGLALGDSLLAFVTGNGLTSAIALIALFGAALVIQKKGLPAVIGQDFSWGKLLLVDVLAWVAALFLSLFLGILLAWLPGGRIIVSLLQWGLFSFIAALMLLRWPSGDSGDEEDSYRPDNYPDDDEIELIS